MMINYLKAYISIIQKHIMTDLQCKYCGYNSTTNANLKRHQTKTVYCLEIQQKIKDGVVQKEENIKRMGQSIRTIRDLEVELKCKDEIIQDLKDQIKILIQNQQNVTLTAITKPTTSVKNTIKNCTIQNLTPLKEAEMRDNIQYLTTEHLKAGAEGYAKYAMEYPLKNKITCTDVSRKKLAWKDVDNNLIYDNEGSKLAEKFFRILKERNFQLFREIINELGDRADAAYKREDQVEADAITELTDKICTWRTEARDAGYGKDNELKNEFIKYLCIASKSD